LTRPLGINAIAQRAIAQVRFELEALTDSVPFNSFDSFDTQFFSREDLPV
jgi:hypothetical protein